MTGPRIDCPLCDWHLEPEPPDYGLYTLADVFGLGVMQAVAYNRHLEETEQALRQHLAGHPLVEWVRKVAELQAEVGKLTDAAAKGKEGRRG